MFRRDVCSSYVFISTVSRVTHPAKQAEMIQNGEALWHLRITPMLAPSSAESPEVLIILTLISTMVVMLASPKAGRLGYSFYNIHGSYYA